MAMFARPSTPSTTHSIGGEGQRPDYALRSIVALICALIMDTGTWLPRSHANGHKNVSRRVNCYNEECAARECATNFSTVSGHG